MAMKPIYLSLLVNSLAYILLANKCVSVEHRKVTVRTSYMEPDTGRLYYPHSKKSDSHYPQYDDSQSYADNDGDHSEDAYNEDHYNSEKTPKRHQNTAHHGQVEHSQAKPQQCYSEHNLRCEQQYNHLDNCVNCQMPIGDYERYIKCEEYYNASIQNDTGSGVVPLFHDPSTVVCCRLNRLMSCVVPVVFRNCDNCALQQFVKKYRPHLELCHLISTMQCPIHDDFLHVK